MGLKIDDSDSSDGGANWRTVKSLCFTEPGSFIRKDRFGRSVETVEFIQEHNEEDITGQMKSAEAPASSYFLGLRSDIEAIERSFFGEMYQPYETIEDLKEFLDLVKDSSPFKSVEALESSYFPGLRNDLEAIKRSFYGEMNRLYDTVEDMKEFLSLVRTDSPSRGIPAETPKEDVPENDDVDGHISEV